MDDFRYEVTVCPFCGEEYNEEDCEELVDLGDE